MGNQLVNNGLTVQLLSNRSLLTPHLTGNFGEVFVKERRQEQQGEFLHRRTVLAQRSTGLGLLEGVLKIHRQNLSERIVKILNDTDILFGQLLLDERIPVVTTEPELFEVAGSQNADTRRGREHIIMHAQAHTVLCEVRELFYPDDVIERARQAREMELNDEV